MKRIFTLSLLFLGFSILSSAQSTKKLNEKNGFKDLTLGTAINNYPDFKISEKKQEGTKEIEVYIYNGEDDSYGRVGEAKLQTVSNTATGYEPKPWIEVWVEDGFIVNIKATFLPLAGTYKTGAYLNSVLQKAYGEPTKKYERQGGKNESFVWDTDKLTMNLRVIGNEYVELVFTKKKHIEDAVDKGTKDL